MAQRSRKKSTGKAAVAATRGTSFLAWGLLLLALTAIAYSPVRNSLFLWDDADYVVNNEVLRSAEGLVDIWFEPLSIPQYYPLVHSSFWLEYRLWGLDPAGYHLVNVLLHALSAWILFVVLSRRLELGTGVAWVAAAIFALHPVHVESVAWITERKNVLSALFFMLSLDAYFRFWPLSSAEPTGRRRDYAFAFGLFVAALLSKTVTASLPAVILVLIWWRHGHLRWRPALSVAPFFAIGGVLAAVTVHLERTHVGAQGIDWQLSFVERCLIAGRALFFYAGKLVWPEPLIFIYPRWVLDTRSAMQVLFPVAFVAVVVCLWALRRRIGRGPLAAVLLFAGMLLPALGFFDVYPMKFSFVADHFQYLASTALITFAVAVIAGLEILRERKWVKRSIVVAVLLALSSLTWSRVIELRDLESVWRDTLEKNPDAWIAHNNLGLMLYESGDLREAEHHYRETIRLEPGYGIAHNNLGILLIRGNRKEEAAEHFELAVRYNPDHARANNNLGQARIDQGRFEEAIPFFLTAIEHSDGYVMPYVNLGKAYLRLQRYGDALDAFREALRIEPGNEAAAMGERLALGRLPGDAQNRGKP